MHTWVHGKPTSITGCDKIAPVYSEMAVFTYTSTHLVERKSVLWSRSHPELGSCGFETPNTLFYMWYGSTWVLVAFRRSGASASSSTTTTTSSSPPRPRTWLASPSSSTSSPRRRPSLVCVLHTLLSLLHLSLSEAIHLTR